MPLLYEVVCLAIKRAAVVLIAGALVRAAEGLLYEDED